jgi:hypothetical protein
MANKTASVLSDAFTNPRPGNISAPVASSPAIIEGLELSEIAYKPVSFFRENPVNEVFRGLKSAQYMTDLEADIAESGIVNPLVAMSDGLLLEGESRLIVARRIGLERLPVRLVLSPLSEKEQEKRLLLGNLLRFEIDTDTRHVLLRKIGFFDKKELSRTEAAEKVGLSERQFKREVAIDKDAEKIAENKGKAAPDISDIKEAREVKNQARRKPSTDTKKVDIIQLESALLSLTERGGEYAESAEIIKGAIGWA